MNASDQAYDGGRKRWSDHAGVVVAAVAAIMAGLAALAGVYQAWVARNTEINQLKAYAYVVPPIWTPILRDATFSAEIAIKNGGSTPAYEVEMNAYAAILPAQLSKSITSYESPETLNITSETFLFKDGVLRVDAKLVDAKPTTFVLHYFTEGDLLNFGSEISRVYVWGRVSYVDAFREPRYLHFCYFFLPSDTTSWNFCAQYNDADEHQEVPAPAHMPPAHTWHFP